MEEKKRTIEEKLGFITKEAVLSVKGVSSLCSNAVHFNLRAKQIEDGVFVLVNNKILSFDIYLNVSFGSKIPQIAFAVQENIKKSIEKFSNLEVDRVNIHVQGIDF